MRAAVLAALTLALALPACADDGGGSPDAHPFVPTWPPAGGIDVSCQYPSTTGLACGPSRGWCYDCTNMQGCYCDGADLHCFAADSVCDFGEGRGCALEGNPTCDTPPAPQYCTCTEGNADCRAVCPYPQCPDYDPGTSACTCADGTCP